MYAAENFYVMIKQRELS